MLALLSSRGFGIGFKQRLPGPYTFTFPSHIRRSLFCSRPPMAFSATSPTSPQPTKRVGTHNGSFHCDEALGCFMIRLTDYFSNAEIVRTRDSQVSPTFLIPIPCLVYEKPVVENLAAFFTVNFWKKKKSFLIYLFKGFRFWRVLMLFLMLGVCMILVGIGMIITRKASMRFLVTDFPPN